MDLILMELLLRQIYDDLSHGRLSQADALAKIKAIKQRERGSSTGDLLAVPVWQAGEMEADATLDAEYGQHCVLLCDRSAADAEKLSSLLRGSDCVSLDLEQGDVAQRYSRVATACFERIQALLRGNRQDKILIQVVVTDSEEQAPSAGVSGMLKTAALEN